MEVDMDDLDTRNIQVRTEEILYARSRHESDRTPYPHVGQSVWYRHTDWDAHASSAEVLWVQSPEDRSDPQLWEPVRQSGGLLLNNRMIPEMVRVPDPWPRVRLRTTHGVLETWESRVRGSAGWFPANWYEKPFRAAQLRGLR